jgi:hypothetical protein
MFRSARPLALLAAFAVLAPGPARAEKKGALSVYNLFSPNSLMGISGLLTRRAVEEGKREGFQVLDPDQAEAKVGRETLKKLKDCDLQPSCLASLSTSLGGGKLFAGTLDRDEVHYLVRLVIVDLDTGQVYASAQRAVLIAARDLDHEFDLMLPELLAGKSEAPTKLTLTSPRKHVRASVDDRPIGELPQTLELSPGRHEVKAEKADYLPAHEFVDLAPGASTTLDLPLTLLPNRVDPDEVVAQPTVHHLAKPEQAVERGAGVPVATWVALGTGVAAGGVGTYFALSEHSIANRAVDANGDGALDITRVEALNAKRDATFANVAFVVAGAAVITGAVLWLSSSGDESAPATSTKVGAMILPGRGGAASVTVGF